MDMAIREKSPIEIQIGTPPSARWPWIVVGTESIEDVFTLIDTYVPQIFLNMVVQNIEQKHVGGGVWDVDVLYGPYRYQPIAPIQSGYRLQFSTGGGTQKITQSRNTAQKKAPPGKTAANFKGAIGYDGKTIQGVDVVVPNFTFTYTTVVAASQITLAYAKQLSALTGTVNATPWKGFDAMSVRFDGVDGQLRSDADSEVGFKFSVSENRLNFSIGNITGINKYGWQYLWIRYKTQTDEKLFVQQPEAVYVEDVYPYTNFGALGIGS